MMGVQVMKDKVRANPDSTETVRLKSMSRNAIIGNHVTVPGDVRRELLSRAIYLIESAQAIEVE
jgi:hypothetical protein